MDAQTAPAETRLEAAPPGPLEALSPAIAAQALAAACDLALIIDGDGVIRDIAQGQGELDGLAVDTWRGCRWIDTVVAENRLKIAEMLAGTGEPGRWRQVNHDTPAGDVPVRYLAIADPATGGIVAIGRDMRTAALMQQRLLRAQQAMERDSLRLRQLEARYRLLFDSAQEAIVIIDATSRQITEANPAARRLAGAGASAGEGQGFTSLIHPQDRDAAVAMLGAVAAAEQRNPGAIRLADGQICQMSAALFRQDRGAYLLVRLKTGETRRAPGDRSLTEVLERMPDGFVLTDAGLNILACNGAFLDLVHHTRADDLRSQPLGRFLGRPGIDLGLLQAQLRDHGLVRNFATIVRADDGREEDVEVSGVMSHEGGELRHGFTLRTRLRREVAGASDRQVPRSVEQLTELVGRVSLKEIVRESTDLIERLCIEAALTYTSDNRASAAEILGLSRQSLYSKLHRHGLGNLSDGD